MLVQTFTQLRKLFPARVDAETLKKLSLAPKNESVVIATLKFLGFIDDEGNKTEKAKKVFLKHEDKSFAAALEKVVKEAYSSLFGQAGDSAWSFDRDSLISFFRVEDETSALTAKRQAITFETLAALSGHGETPAAKPQRSARRSGNQTPNKPSKATKAAKQKHTKTKSNSTPISNENDIALTVRVEINLPAQGDQATYDRIFQSIRKNLLNG
jgi:hypothetical protein